jgi:hypothetical protein
MGIVKKPTKRKPRNQAKFTKSEMVKKMLEDQAYIRNAIANGISFEELEKQGFKFARVQSFGN